MPQRRKKTGSQILKEWLKRIKKNSSPRSINSSPKSNDYIHHHNNDTGVVDGSKYLQH
jgi:hypothetical protein